MSSTERLSGGDSRYSRTREQGREREREKVESFSRFLLATRMTSIHQGLKELVQLSSTNVPERCDEERIDQQEDKNSLKPENL